MQCNCLLYMEHIFLNGSVAIYKTRHGDSSTIAEQQYYNLASHKENFQREKEITGYGLCVMKFPVDVWKAKIGSRKS